jgi:hypothetical protein
MRKLIAEDNGLHENEDDKIELNQLKRAKELINSEMNEEEFQQIEKLLLEEMQNQTDKTTSEKDLQ